MSWIRKRLGPAAKALAASEIASFADSSAVAVVGFFPSNTDATFKIFESIASGLDEVPFGVSFDAEAAKGEILIKIHLPSIDLSVKRFVDLLHFTPPPRP